MLLLAKCIAVALFGHDGLEPDEEQGHVGLASMFGAILVSSVCLLLETLLVGRLQSGDRYTLR